MRDEKRRERKKEDAFSVKEKKKKMHFQSRSCTLTVNVCLHISEAKTIAVTTVVVVFVCLVVRTAATLSSRPEAKRVGRRRRHRRRVPLLCRLEHARTQMTISLSSTTYALIL
jgi:hypothetical protein